jgi:uncharacterized membrane protein
LADEEARVIDTLLHWFGFGLCHQLPARSFFGAGGHQVPVCARDTGIYIGFVLSFALIALIDRGRRRSGLPAWPALVLAGLFVAVMAWDGVTSYAGLRATDNAIRLITGLLAGWALPVIVYPLVTGSLWRRSSPDRSLSGTLDIVMWVLPIPAAFALVWWVMPLLGVWYPLLVVAAVMATFVGVNMVIALLPSRFDRSFERVRDAWVPMIVAFALSAAEIGLAAWLRIFLQSLAGVR